MSERPVYGDRPPWSIRLRSLPARISLLVLVATLATSLSATAMSVLSMDSFLRAKIDRKFPDILAGVIEALDHMYEQRALEMKVFSSSAILLENLEPIARGQRPERAKREIEQYLGYVLASVPQYTAAFVLDAKGEPIAFAGSPAPLSPALQRRMAKHAFDKFPIYSLTPEKQVAHDEIEVLGERIASIHALLRREPMEALLASADLGPTGSVFVIDETGAVVLGAARGGFDAAVLASPEEPGVRDYHKQGGDRTIGTARSLGRFGWTVVVEEAYDEAFAPTVAAIERVVSLNLVIAGVLCATAFVGALTIVRPINALAAAASAIGRGERDVPIPAIDNQDEVGLLARTLESMVEGLATKQREIERSHAEVEAANCELQLEKHELERANEVLEQLSVTDGLTKLHNHRFFQDQLAREAKRADRMGNPLSLILVDIDHFKSWNDRLGHATGDEILRKLANTLNETVRDTDLVARYGGEEFAVLLVNTPLDGAVALAEKVRQRVAETQFLIDLPGQGEIVTVSAGVALYRGDRLALFNDADEALYAAKSAGRNCVMAAGLEERF
jgi:diguanylate cyclase (GGDEF)-like protein